MAALQAEVTALVAATQVAASSIQASATHVGETLQAAAEAARRQVDGFVRDFYERKIFDRFLEFSSDEDKDAYRKREAERRETIEREHAKGTPKGDLAALRLETEQLKDAGAHGADRSPDFAPLVRQTADAKSKLESALGEPSRAATRAERFRW